MFAHKTKKANKYVTHYKIRLFIGSEQEKSQH